uniref:Histone acetyltransferase n=1 Tax=Parascaris univalens TaxID=6257 RepID=A0A915ATT9_PARUN
MSSNTRRKPAEQVVAREHLATAKITLAAQSAVHEYRDQLVKVERRITRSLGPAEELSVDADLPKRRKIDVGKSYVQKQVVVGGDRRTGVVNKNWNEKEAHESTDAQRKGGPKNNKLKSARSEKNKRKHEKEHARSNATDQRPGLQLVAQNGEAAYVDAGDHFETSKDEAAKKLPKSLPMKTRAWTRMRCGLENGEIREFGDRDHLGTSNDVADKNMLHSPPIKTRAWTRMRRRLIPHCHVCKGDSDGLKRCCSCRVLYHLQCLEYTTEHASLIAETRKDDWLCPKCTFCTVCAEYISDRENVQCFMCDRAYHGACRPHAEGNSESFDPTKTFYCPECASKKPSNIKNEEMESLTTNDESENGYGGTQSTETSSSGDRIKRREINSLWFVPRVKAYIQEERDEVNDRMKQYAERVKKQRALGLVDGTNRPGTSRMGMSESSSDDEDVFAQLRTSKAGKDGVAGGGVQLYSAPIDYALYVEAKKRLSEDLRESSEHVKTGREQWVHFAGYEMQAVNLSPFPAEFTYSPHLYMCAFCLKAANLAPRYNFHMKYCDWWHPPGNQIYKEGKLAFWEVDGANEPKYCRRLCLLAILFLPSKVAYREVEAFTFYVLTELTRDGYQLAGYFSKEKESIQNNNLSCLLVLPYAQRSGYGKMLIDLSYKLSLREKKIGGPEHPLSDLGLITYRSYWKAAIVSYIRQRYGRRNISVKEISDDTGIHAKDIVPTLAVYNLLKLSTANFYINVKKICRLPLRSFRHRIVHDEKLMWKPGADDGQDFGSTGPFVDRSYA